MSLNPPLYGADTDVSFFDKSLPFGWNLHDLGDLLREHDVPDIPGVTTPMTYFGMWKVCEASNTGGIPSTVLMER